ncbi:PAS domain-containing sensor histidine kinase [Nocardioides solisilvae]|uniref:PAS domain-containing sensor histidine kinase n=1 Tax=Nocardioides solisilvae TaxID=1542435 RepID=UPI000D740D6E|nr:PAS domain-containing hybrid sensor histidine kinase/response regulator [Nocardioides solisilvae]
MEHERSHLALAGSSLEEDRERYRSLFLHTPHAAFALDLDGCYQAVNPASTALTGYTEDEFLAMGYDEVIHPDDLQRVVDTFREVAAGHPATVACGVRRKDGARVEVEITGVPVIVDGRVIGVHGVAQDVTERNRALRELETARKVAEEANDAKSLFLANVSHELRTPLAAAVAALELLEDVPMPDLGKNLVATVQRSGDRLSRLVDDLLDFIDLATGRAKLHLARFEPRATLAQLTEIFAPEAAARGLEMSVEIDPEVPDVLLGDAPRLNWMAYILLENALKFTDEGGIRVRCRVVGGLGAPDEPVDVCLEVADTGIGISPERQGLLFDPFVQGDGSMTRRHGGTGLGLAIFRELVTLHGGSYALTSEVGVGTTVSVTVPMVRAPQEEPAAGR